MEITEVRTREDMINNLKANGNYSKFKKSGRNYRLLVAEQFTAKRNIRLNHNTFQPLQVQQFQPPTFQQPLQIQGLQSQQKIMQYIAQERNRGRGKRNKKQRFRDIETSIQSNMRNKHDKFHNVYTQNWFRLVHKLSSRSHKLLLE